MRTSNSRFAGKVLISKRGSQVAELERLLADRESLVLQLKQVDGMIAATRAYIRELDVRSGVAPGDRRLRGALSIRDMALQVLRDAAAPMKVAEIRKAIEQKFGQQIERTSISPILSKMAQDGHLRHDAEVGWSIPK